MVFVETSKFTQLVLKWLSEDEYRDLQRHLSEYPEDGKQIKGTGGIRKIYWKREGKGKLGGVRVIYYWVRKQDVILMLFLYPKSVSSDLSPEQRKILQKIVEEEYP